MKNKLYICKNDYVMSKKKLKLGIKQRQVNSLYDVQSFVIKNGKDKYLEAFDELENMLNSSEKKINSYIYSMLPDNVYCSVENKGEDYIKNLSENDKRYDGLDMFYTVIDFYYIFGTYIGNVVFGIDTKSFNDSKKSINVVCIFNVVNDLDLSYKEVVDELFDVYRDQENGIMSLLKIEDFLSYLLADKFVEDHISEYIYIEKLNDVGLPAYFEIVPENVEDVVSLAKKRMEMFSKRVSETTQYIVSSVKSDNKSMYVTFNDKTTEKAKFQYQIDLTTEEEYISMAKDDSMSKSKMEKCIERFRKLHDVEFLLNHVYDIFKVMVYCQTFKKTFDVLPN